ncbi:PAS domain-containing sensor histidine kinase [Pseudoduganella umbonata]|uniref:Virulence sensor protein BvgS n=1 Tax=Pseudoduganella umbonata TaxID=864828 RepID=A0A4P8HJT7_9BURK|nr:PAS domain S-box protein [Pseudoduganella umbonata]MBB3221691.1 PAS domain S-box-containing protein [Pseudoduganella umbonata]QCP09086.1 PAS domain S-box protein [Pseudoduganella umbonata]
MGVTDFSRMILEETPDAVIITTAKAVIVHWSQGAAQVFGYSAEEAQGRVLTELVSSSTMRTIAHTVIVDTLKNGHATHEAICRAKDGSIVFIDSVSKRVADPAGQGDYILWTKRDVTTLRVARDAALVEARFGRLLESVPDAIIMANAAGRIVLANLQAHQLFRYAQGELRGQLLEILIPERYRRTHVGQRAGFWTAPSQRPMGIGRELYGLRQDGEEFPVEISLSPLQTEDGMLVMSAIRDMSERKRIEHALHDKNAELAAASLAKDSFLSSMSHELRTPLNAIIGFTGTLLMRLPGPINAAQESQLRTVQTSAKHLLSLINDILDITKITSGTATLHRESFDCCRLVEDIATMFMPLASAKDLNLRVLLAEPCALVMSDRRAVQQIVINLVNNALKFTEMGEVRIEVAIDDAAAGPVVAIRVVDTGIGIEQGNLGMLFKPFTQIDQGSTRQYEGTGLGLHLSERLADLIGASIAVDSEVGTGSTFTVRLPLAE